MTAALAAVVALALSRPMAVPKDSYGVDVSLIWATRRETRMCGLAMDAAVAMGTGEIVGRLFDRAGRSRCGFAGYVLEDGSVVLSGCEGVCR